MKIRLWKLGSLDPLIVPSRENIERFKEVLKDAKEEGVVDLVWGPDVDCQIIDVDDTIQQMSKLAQRIKPAV